MHDPMSRLVDYVRTTSRELVREWGFLRGCPNESGVPASQAHTLIEIAKAGSVTLKELADLLVVDESTSSRVAKALTDKKLTSLSPSSSDGRAKILSITENGQKVLKEIDDHANGMVRAALSLLSEEERDQVSSGLRLYAKALKKARFLSALSVRPIRKSDNAALERLIKTVMPEFGADGPGFAIHDPGVRHMYETYREKRSYYLVVEKGGELLGGAGITPLAGGDKETCELNKMYLYPEGRGYGLGNLLVQRMLEKAAELGYKRCYLETLERMDRANHLYQKLGFTRIKKPLGATGHFGCDRWYVKELVS